jgi:polyphenol oxidase
MKGILHSPLFSSLPGLSHGFTTLELIQGDLSQISQKVSTLHQVHGNSLFWAQSFEKKERKGDALATRKGGLAVGVYSADCLPALVAAFKNGLPLGVMAVHAGWRGTAQRILARSLEEFGRSLGPCELYVALGPAIGFDAFEVGQDVIDAFPACLGTGRAKVHPANPGKFFFDLVGENMAQAREAAAKLGMALHLDIRSPCTHSTPDLFPSYRRDGASSDRILSFIEILPS